MKNLVEKAYLFDYCGVSRLVIDDQALLDWAAQNQVSPAVAQLRAVEAGIAPLRYLKNLEAVSLDEQRSICRGRVLVCGCGGLGGTLIQLLARAGVGLLRVVDGDIFAPTNLNRQLLSESLNLAHSKALTAAQKVRAINPLIEVEAVNEMIQQENVESVLAGLDLVMDALDNLPARFLLAETAAALGIPFIHGAVAGWWGQISTFPPGSRCGLGHIYGKRRARDPAEEAVGVLGPTAAAIGSLQALEAIRLLAGRQPAYSEKLLYFDGESGRMDVIPL